MNSQRKRVSLVLIIIMLIMISISLLDFENIRHVKRISELGTIISGLVIRNSTEELVSSTARKPWKNIIFYTSYWGYRESWDRIFGRALRNECEENRCIINTEESNIEGADAVIFYANDLILEELQFLKISIEKINSLRKPDQIFVLYIDESPSNVQYINFDKYKNFFNWTMSYKRDADIIVPYGKVTKRLTKRPKKQIPLVTNSELKEKKLAVAVISHCLTQSRREVFIRELQKYIPIDVYGKCGNLSCGENRHKYVKQKITADPCVSLTKKYAFYLAFENSICKDYVTEKFYRPLLLGTVPVVLGGVNYSQFAPQGSYIDVKDFQSMEHLANYLKRVANDARLYNKYLQWKTDFDVDIGHPYRPFVCDLCKKLHSDTFKRTPKFHPNIQNWFLNGTCLALQDFIRYNLSETFKNSLLQPLNSLFL